MSIESLAQAVTIEGTEGICDRERVVKLNRFEAGA